MRRFLLISGILLAAAQYVVAEEGKPVPAKDVKPSSVQLHDIVKVLVEDCPTAEGGPTHCKEIIASVEGIQPNGVLRIEGRNQTLVGDDVWERTVSGEVRPPSIRPDRTVRGEDVAKFHYKVCKRPMVHDAAAPGEVFPNPVLPHPVRQVAAETVESRKTAELRQKLAELNRLQREIRELRAETGTAQAIRVNVQMVEVNMTKLRQMKTDFSTADFGFVKMDGAGVLENPMQRGFESPHRILGLVEGKQHRESADKTHDRHDGRSPGVDAGRRRHSVADRPQLERCGVQKRRNSARRATDRARERSRTFGTQSQNQ